MKLPFAYLTEGGTEYRATATVSVQAIQEELDTLKPRIATLSRAELRDRMAHGQIEHVTPVNGYALSLADDPTRPQDLVVRIENQVNRRLDGVLRLKVNGAEPTTSAPFAVAAARLTEVRVPWPGVPRSANNQYAVTLSAAVGMPTVTVSRQQMVSMASFRKRTIAVDGDLRDWKGITPVVLDSRMLSSDVDLSQYLLNPHRERPADEAAKQRLVARVYTAYDDRNVYLAAAVTGASGQCVAGQPTTKGRGETRPVSTSSPRGTGRTSRRPTSTRKTFPKVISASGTNCSSGATRSCRMGTSTPTRRNFHLPKRGT
jgi:hypothetical protein